MQKRKPILITGSHRSGSTWVSKIISESSSVAYIHEPFNLGNSLSIGISKAKFDYWFTYICSKNELDFYHEIKNIIKINYILLAELKRVRQLKQFKRIVKEYFKNLQYKYYKMRPLIKDPIALLSAEWLQSKFNMDTVVLIRHPAAFVNSIKRWNWSFPFEHFLEQPLLMRDYGYHFENEIKDHVKQKYDIIEQAILLWKILHFRILQYQQRYINNPNWIFIRHEDISREPLSGFQRIFDFLNLELTGTIKNSIEKSSSYNNPTEGKTVHSLKRNSQANIKRWKNQLTPEEIHKIRERVEEIFSFFYSDKNW